MSAPKFIFAGLGNTFISYLAFLVLFRVSQSALLALIAGLVAGIASSYSLNKFWVWKSEAKGSLIRFLGIQLVILSVNWLTLHFISLTIFPREIAQFFLYGIFAVAQYKINRDYVFRERP